MILNGYIATTYCRATSSGACGTIVDSSTARHGHIGCGPNFTHALRRRDAASPSNVDNLAFFRDILDPLLTIGGEGAARLSYHPRTFARIDEFGFAGTVRHAGST